MRPLAVVNEQGTKALIRELGIVDAIRFLGQFSTGSGDYTKDRRQWIGEPTPEELIAEIEAHRRAATGGSDRAGN